MVCKVRSHVDFITQKVRVLTIPRDFNMPIPGFEEHSITEGRISAAYGYGEPDNAGGAYAHQLPARANPRTNHRGTVTLAGISSN